MSQAELDKLIRSNYEAGFTTTVDTETLPPGLSEEVIRFLSAKKGEPEWMLEWRLDSYRKWQEMPTPGWAHLHHPPIDFNEVSYYSKPKSLDDAPKSLDEVDPELLATYEKLGIPLHEQEMLAGVAVDVVFDSSSVFTTFKEKLWEAGVIFCSISEAIQEYPELVQKYMGSVVPKGDNFYAALNSAVFSDGSFVYIPKGVRCPMELSTYFRINEANTGQFERTLIIADEGSSVHYIEGCTAPTYSSDSLHSAVVELIALKDARIRYTTIQNWSTNVYNLVTKRAHAHEGAVVEWVDGNIGSKLTMKYPAIVLKGERAHGEVLSIAFAGHDQHQDAGAKMIHAAPNTTSRIVSKSISKDDGRSSYRGLVQVARNCPGCRTNVECDALLIGDEARSDTYPTMDIAENQVKVEHEARVSKVAEEQLFYLQSRGLNPDQARMMIVNGFIEPFVKELPMEYAVELNRLIELEMEGSIG
jgi:Fe-S cluster assembly protein SufB